MEEGTIGETFNGPFDDTCFDAAGESMDGTTNEGSSAVVSRGTCGNAFSTTLRETPDEPVGRAYPGMIDGTPGRAFCVKPAGPSPWTVPLTSSVGCSVLPSD